MVSDIDLHFGCFQYGGKIIGWSGTRHHPIDLFVAADFDESSPAELGVIA
jgi:hypothetical protein